MFEDVEIQFFKGTHRVRDPKETIEINENKLRTAGITRLTEITDLDRIKIPVFSAIRPTAQEGGVSVYAGKGATKEQAKASAMMEGFERYSAERQDIDNERTFVDTYNNIKSSQELKALDPRDLLLPKNFTTQNVENSRLEWIESKDIISEETIYVPSNAVFHPYIPTREVIPSPLAIFKGNTNGLASGNIIEESVLHGIFEVVERDAWSLFELTKRNKKEINQDTIENDIINELLAKFNNEGINIKLMDITADLKITTVAASADDTVLKDPALLTLGVGTHLDPNIAVIRALTEVAQSRATQIHGTREDTIRADFMRKSSYEGMKRMNKHYFQKEEDTIDLSDIEDKSSHSIKKDIETSIEEVQKVGFDKVLYTDLTREEIGINVARVIIPKAELYSLDEERLGTRALEYDRKARRGLV
ncbi:methanogenesis marker protein 1 [Methanobrevibacter ruminantium M1]|uniref:Methanogenesis marker protein 1 n=1 Tax=Methanobrevibacter ruminantium (strain ATCC 35063 / DSM 1093 / JCM 13430 / OCM 146 / M1) TaxID=634498 RepID=D3E1V8_METRM|nr:YcaO-related McrA-glycine thioamidation protein [Methanobrevibacter ruminantium]ADC46519.1 methanogenesis marker protein 1 [Methanobrevibacter ruminantium M1]